MTDNALTENPRKAGRPPGAAELATMRGVLEEMAKTYRQAKAGQVDHKTARSLIWMLAQIRDTIEMVDLEQTLVSIEKSLAEREGRVLPAVTYNPPGAMVQ